MTESSDLLVMGLAGLVFIISVIILIWATPLVYQEFKGRMEYCKSEGLSFFSNDCIWDKEEIKCQDDCERFNLKFFRYKEGCWCIYDGLPKQIY